MGHVILTLYNPSVDQKDHFHKKFKSTEGPGVDPPNPPDPLSKNPGGGQPPQNPKFGAYVQRVL